MAGSGFAGSGFAGVGLAGAGLAASASAGLAGLAGSVRAAAGGATTAGRGASTAGSGAGAAATGAAAAASSAITCIFTSLRIFVADSRAASAWAWSAYGPTRTRQAGRPLIVSGVLKPGRPDCFSRAITLSASPAEA